MAVEYQRAMIAQIRNVRSENPKGTTASQSTCPKQSQSQPRKRYASGLSTKLTVGGILLVAIAFVFGNMIRKSLSITSAPTAGYLLRRKNNEQM